MPVWYAIMLFLLLAPHCLGQHDTILTGIMILISIILNGIIILISMSRKETDDMAPGRLSRQQSRLQTQERLLEAATLVFSRHGFDAASVEEIAEEAGYSKGAVYSNFASKEELFLTLLDRHLEAELRSVTAQFAQKSNHESSVAQDRSFPAHLQERRTWNVLTLD